MKRILSFAAAAVMALTALPFGSDSMHAGAATVFDDTSLTEYHIATVQDLVDFSKASQTYKDKAVYLDADIDMQDIAWEPKIFDGYFDGQYHTISHLHIEQSTPASPYSFESEYGGTYVGLFSVLNGTTVRLNLAETTSIVHTSSVSWEENGQALQRDYVGYAGGLCGKNCGNIYGCTVYGTFKTDWKAVDDYGGRCDFPTYKSYSGSIAACNDGTIQYCSGEDPLCGETESKAVLKNCEPDYGWSRSEVDQLSDVQKHNLIAPELQDIPADDFGRKNAKEYRITTAEGLVAFAMACQEDSFYGKTVYLDADIDMTGIEYPVPKYFQGTFDGRYHRIYGLSIDGWTDDNSHDLNSMIEREYRGAYPYDVSAFVLENHGNICRLSLTDVQITVLCGVYATGKYYEQEGFFADAAVISICPYVGAICARNEGVVSECDAAGTYCINRNDTAGSHGTSAYVYDCFGNKVTSDDLNEEWPLDRSYEAPSKYPLSEPEKVQGDVNADGKFDVADVVLLQKWILKTPKTSLKDADMNQDGVIDIFDLALLKRKLLAK